LRREKKRGRLCPPKSKRKKKSFGFGSGGEHTNIERIEGGKGIARLFGGRKNNSSSLPGLGGGKRAVLLGEKRTRSLCMRGSVLRFREKDCRSLEGRKQHHDGSTVTV